MSQYSSFRSETSVFAVHPGGTKMYQRLTTPLLVERNTKRCGSIRSQMPYVSASKGGTPVTWRDALALANIRKEMGACNNGLTRSPR